MPHLPARLLLALLASTTPLPAQTGMVPRPTVPETRAAQATMPAVVGLPLDRAREVLAEQGVQVGRVTRSASTSAAPGSIIRQRPAAGTAIQAGVVANLVVAESASQARVPNVVGMTREVARRTLAAAGVQVAGISEAAGEGAPGTVVRQSPAAGSPVGQGATASLVVAAAAAETAPTVPPAGTRAPDRPREVTVPTVTGQRLSVARGILLLRGLPGLLGDSVESALPAGTVVSQVPEAGARVAPRTPVRLTLARSSGRVVPAVTGMTETAARSILEAAGLRTGEMGRTEADQPPGTILRQDPAAGSRVPPGTPVRLSVSVPRMAVVPDLRRLTRERATVTLREAGLVPGQTTVSESEGPAGAVLSQSRAPGTRVEPGTPLDFVISAPPRVVAAPAPAADSGRSVPSVVGLTLAEARARLRSSGLQGAPDVDSARWRVARQDPAAGTRLTAGARVVLALATPATAAAPPPPDTLAAAPAPGPEAAAPAAETRAGSSAEVPPLDPPLQPAAAGDAPGLPWLWFVLAAAIAMVLLALAAFRLRRTRIEALPVAQAPLVVPGLNTEGRWASGETEINAPGKLVGGPVLRIRGVAGVPLVSLRRNGRATSSAESRDV